MLIVTRAANLGPRIDSTLTRIRSIIPTAIKSVEKDVSESNRNKVIIALLNFAGSVLGSLNAIAIEKNLQDKFKKEREKVFGTNNSTADWNEGNIIQFFSNIVAGYGYWGRYALELQDSEVKCGPQDLERTLVEYSRITNYKSGSFDSTVGAHFANELNTKIKENLYCLIANPTYPKNKVTSELEAYVKTYTNLLSYIIRDLEKAPVT